MPRVLSDVIMAVRLLHGLHGYLRQPLTIDQCRAIVRRRLATREDDFLALINATVFADRASPYFALLKMAGCTPGDLERLTRLEGVEGALGVLYREGVYLTVDEFKGRRPVVRGSVSIETGADMFRNRLVVPHLLASTSGSRGTPSRVMLNISSIRDRAVNMCLALDARAGATPGVRWRTAIWNPRGTAPMLWYAGCGEPPARWFLQTVPQTLGFASPFRWSIRAVALGGRLAGVRLPTPQHVAVDAPAPIIEWMRHTLRAGEVPHLWGAPSAMVRLCQTAEESGIDLAGARFTITGEPITDARLAAIRRVHGDAVPDYGSVDSGGSISSGCLSAAAPDDVHVFNDLVAVIQADRAPFPDGALLVSSLRSTSPFILLNVSMGDRATMTSRRCGCALEALGWETHLHSIRSFEKLNAGGMTFEDSNVIQVLEEVLPRRFGGGPSDYQLVEEDGHDSHPRLLLLVRPSVGPLDPATVSDVFLDALGGTTEATRIMADHWRQAGFLHVERRAPHATRSGKILHLVSAPEGR